MKENARLSPAHQHTAAWIVVLTIVLYAASVSALHAAKFHFNYSNSVPIGLYRESAPGKGAYAGFCLSHSRLLKDLEVVRGACPDGFAPVLKPVLQATAIRPIIFTQQGFVIDGKLIPNTAPRTRTHSGVVLAHYPFGTYSDGLWAISDFNPNSYDSRYFGPVKEADIRFYVQPLFTHR